jgi:hypothetical protein
LAGLRHDAEVVADEEHPQRAFLRQADEQPEDPGLNRDIQRGGGLVYDQKVGLSSKPEGKTRTLPHAS